MEGSGQIRRIIGMYFKVLRTGQLSLTRYRHLSRTKLVALNNLWHKILHKPEIMNLRLTFSNNEKEDKSTNKDNTKEADEEVNNEEEENKNEEDKGMNMNEDRPYMGAELIALGLLFILTSLVFRPNKKDPGITQEELVKLLKQKEIEKIKVIQGNPYARIYFRGRKGESTCKYKSSADFIEKCNKELDATSIEPKDRPEIIEYAPYESSVLNVIITIVILIALIGMLRRFLFRSLDSVMKKSGISNANSKNLMGMDNIFKLIFGGKGFRAVEYGKNKKMNVKFKDVAGMKGPKEEIQEFVNFLKSPEKFRKLGAKIPKGALLSGPPGTGKTLLAKACAGEAGVPFFATSGSEFVEMIGGLGSYRVRNLFAEAKKKSPSIIFIDEIDSIGRRRSGLGRNSEAENTLNQIFVELDGFGTSTNVVVFAATNRKDALDKALIRPGRFDRLIEVDLPNLEERKEIFEVHLKDIVVSEDLEKSTVAEKLGALTMGMSGAEIYSICNEAAIMAARNNKPSVDMDAFYEAFDRVLTGLKRDLPLTKEDKRTTAIHEAGHAVVAWFLKHAQDVLKVSIIPRSKGSLGHTITMTEEVQLYRKEQIEDIICTMYGGRAAEELFLESITTGAQNDLQNATALGKKYVGVYGMASAFGNVSVLSYDNSLGIETNTLFSGESAKKFDRVVFDLCEKQYARTKDLLREKRKEVKRLAERLEEKETVELDEIKELLGPSARKTDENFNSYIEDLKAKKNTKATN